MRLNSRRTYGLAVFTLIVAPLVGAGQQADENLKGVIVDQMGASVAGAKILIMNGSARLELKSNEMGAFSVEVPQGSYQVLVESIGFRIAKLNRVQVRSASPKEIRVVLKVKPVKHGKCPKGQNCIWL